MSTKVIDLSGKRKERNRRRIIAKTNQYYLQYLEKSWSASDPKRKE